MQEASVVEQITLKLNQVTSLLKDQRRYICTAESCTGGQLAMWLTELAGSSEWFERGFITYSNEAKASLLAVDPELVENSGAVSEPVAKAMAKGALLHSNSQIAIAITGIAGPSGGGPGKPVGTVCFAVAAQSSIIAETKYFDAKDRQTIRAQSCLHALTMVEQFIQ